MARGERLVPARGGERTRSPLDCGRCGELVWCAGVVAVRVTDRSLARYSTVPSVLCVSCGCLCGWELGGGLVAQLTRVINLTARSSPLPTGP